MYNPVVSVVTVCYNAVDVIEKTITSVLSQTYNNIEYIVVDGVSSDGTLDVLNNYKSHISTLVSEPDKGIYDAMNKAIDLAHGEWILFLNAGDYFADKDVLSHVFQREGLSDFSVVYGDTIMKSSWGTFIDQGKFFSSADEHLPFCHQSVLVKTQLMKVHKFDLSYKIVADYNFFYNLYVRKEPFVHIDELISEYDTEGFSSQRVLDAYVEVSKINGTYHTWMYWRKITRLRLRNLMLSIIPNQFVVRIRKFKRRKSI